MGNFHYIVQNWDNFSCQKQKELINLLKTKRNFCNNIIYPISLCMIFTPQCVGRTVNIYL